MTPSLAVGEYLRPNAKDASRSPCPVINALANHGYLERDGQKIYMDDLNASMRHVGMSPLLGSVFAIPTYFEYHGNPATSHKAASRDKRKNKPIGSFWRRTWSLLRNPYSFFDYFGCWNPTNIDPTTGKKFLRLQDLAAHGAIEHDVSLSRRDVAQPEGNNDPQGDLIAEMLDYSYDGNVLTVDDLARFIKARIRRQLEDNPELVYGPDEHQVNCGQVALMMGCFGDGKTIPVEYVRAIFEEERLPIREGWKRRWWWTMGLIEFFGAVRGLVRAVGVTFS